MLEVRDLSVWYGDVPAVRGVSLTVNQGEVVALLGSNGAGKSTTLMAISGALERCRGQVRFLGQDLLGQRAYEVARRGIAHVPEGRRIFPTLSVEENLRLGAYADRRRFKENLDYIYQLFPILQERRGQAGGSLSGGEQQMLAIGRALMSGPKLLMLDEPSLGLAPRIVDLIYEVIGQLRQRGLTILLVEQNPTIALGVADRAYILQLGELVWHGPSQEAMASPQVLAGLLGRLEQ
ncbi:MAG: ABC transporter ATP-binding protein [Limnochordales bacterium]